MTDFREVLSQKNPWTGWTGLLASPQICHACSSSGHPGSSPLRDSFWPPSVPVLPPPGFYIHICFSCSPGPASRWTLVIGRVLDIALLILLGHICASVSQGRHTSAQQKEKVTIRVIGAHSGVILFQNNFPFSGKCSRPDIDDAGMWWRGPLFLMGNWGTWYSPLFLTINLFLVLVETICDLQFGFF